MDDISSKKIVQHNDLIMSVAKMDRVPLKFFELAVACLDTENIPKDKTVQVSKDLLYSFFDAKSENKHTRFKEAVLRVHEQAVFSIRELDDETDKWEYQMISPLEKTSWNSYADTVSFKFTESILPFLIDLKENFTQYLLSDIANLNSKHSIIIYKWLSMNYNQFDYYQYKNNRSPKQLYNYQNPTITVKELRRLTDTETELRRFYDFEKRVLKVAEGEINKHTSLNMSYRKIKKGRSIHSIQFFITKKAVTSNSFYKLEQQDQVYLQSKAEYEQQQANLVKQALENNYTELLLERLLIGIRDLRNTELLAYLQKGVYPLYDELKKLKGGKGVEEHLNYVQAKQAKYSKNNIGKYLKTAVVDYLHQVKRDVI